MEKIAYEQPSMAPTAKVTAATAAAAVVGLISWIVHEYTGVEVPLHVQGSLITIFVFASGYYIKNRERVGQRDHGEPIAPHDDEDLLPEQAEH